MKLDSMSERQQVVAIILVVAAVMIGLWLFILMPLAKDRKLLERKVRTTRNDLAANNYLLGLAPLQNKQRQLQTRLEHMTRQWQEVTERLGAYDDPKMFADSSFRRVDFKVRLLQVRQRLQSKAEQLGVLMPDDLVGISEQVYSADETRELMLQLEAVERLVDLVLKLDIPRVRHLEALKPIRYELASTGEDYMEDYPVQLVFQGTIKNVENLIHAALGPEHVYVFRHLRVEKVSPEYPDLLEVRAVLSAFLFYKDPEDLGKDDMPPPLMVRPRGA